jgi:hypothetical protein
MYCGYKLSCVFQRENVAVTLHRIDVIVSNMAQFLLLLKHTVSIKSLDTRFGLVTVFIGPYIL